MHRVLWFHLAYSVCKRCIVRLQLLHIELPVPSLSFGTCLFACKPRHASSQTGHCQLLLGNCTFRVYQRRETNTSDAFAVCKLNSIANPPALPRPRGPLLPPHPHSQPTAGSSYSSCDTKKCSSYCCYTN